MASPVADLVIRISADSADFQNGLKNAEGWAKTFGKTVDTSFVGIATAGAAAAAAVVTGTAAMVTAFANTADQALQTAKTLDMNVEALSRLRFAADLSGSSAGAMDSALAKMNKNIGEATMGTGEAANALKSLGLNAQQLADMGAEKAFLQISDALNTVENSSQRAAIGADIFGKQFSEQGGISNVVAQGSADIAAMGKSLDELGGTFETGVAIEAERFNDNLTTMGALSTGFAQQVSGEVLPTMNLLSEDFINAAKNSEALKITAEGLGIAFKSVVTAAISVKWALGTVVDFLGAIGIAMERLISGEFEGAANAFTEFGEDRAKQAEADASRIVDIWTAVPGDIAQGTSTGGKGKGIVIADRAAAAAAAKERARLQKQLEDQLTAFDTQEQAVENTLNMRQELYAEFFEAGLITETQYNELQVQAREDYWSKIDQLDQEAAERERQRAKRAADERRAGMTLQLEDVYLLNQNIGQAVQQLTDWEVLTSKQKYLALASLAQNALNSYSQTSRKAFEAAKALSIATTVINTADAAVGAYKALAGIPYIGPALGAAAAAAAIAFGMGQVRAIKATQFGGGGGGGGVAGLSAPTAAGDVGGGGFSTGSRQSPEITVVIQDDALVSGATVRRLVEGISEALADGANGGTITVAGGGY